MEHLSLNLYWENLKQKYLETETTMYDLSKMMARNIKLYTIVEQIINIYKLIKKTIVSEILDFYFTFTNLNDLIILFIIYH